MKKVLLPVAVLATFILFLQLFAVFDASLITLPEILQPPTTTHLFGSDELGRDVLSRLAHGVQVSLKVGISVLIIAGTIGTVLGIVSGYFGGWVDSVLMRITDVFLSFPGILIAISFAALAGPGVENVILALGLMGWVSFARLARVETLTAKTQDYVAAAHLSGVKTTPVLLRYVLPNISAPLIIESVFTVAGAMVAEAGLSFLGIGIQPPEPSLGSMLREGARYMLVAPHLVLAPGCTLMILVLTLNITADRLRDWLDVRYNDDHEKTNLILTVFLLTCALFLPLVAQARDAVVNKIRLGQHGEMTRVVLESDKPLKPNHFTLPTPPRFVVDFPEIEFKKKLVEVTLPETGLVNGLRQGLFRPGVVRMVVDLKKASVASVFTIPASKKTGYRLVIDLKPATEAQIASRKQEIEKKRAKLAKQKKSIAKPLPPKQIRKVKKDKFVVVLDPGHGGVDPGAVSRKRLYEKNIVLAVAKKAEKELGKRKDVEVHLTRSRDIFLPLQERVAFAQKKDADLFISLHADAHRNKKVRGGSVYVLSDKASDKEAARLARHANDGDMVAGINLSEESKDVRDILIDLTQRETMNKSAQLAKEILGEIGGVVKLRKKNILFAGFRVLKAPEIPSILVEMSYISNPNDEKILKSGKKQTQIAQKIARGVDRYIQKHVHN